MNAVQAMAVALVALCGLVAFMFLNRRRRRARKLGADEGRCRRCNYDLRGQSIPRCPECGTLRGFDVPLEELGLTDREIREGFARRQNGPAEPAAGDRPGE